MSVSSLSALAPRCPPGQQKRATDLEKGGKSGALCMQSSQHIQLFVLREKEMGYITCCSLKAPPPY
jgi:hypothetical protein